MFELIKGGALSKEASPKKFIAAKISNTRLMGSLYVYAKWHILNCSEAEVYHQFFYLDIEEYGIDSYHSVWDDDLDQVNILEMEMAGPLGGAFVDISEKELSFLISQSYNKNLSSGTPLPTNKNDFEFLVSQPPVLSIEEEYALLSKECVPTVSPVQLIHYFIMRCFGKDFPAASFLATGDVDPIRFKEFDISTLCRNKVELLDADTFGTNTYKASSLIESNDSYSIVIFLIQVSDVDGILKVASFEKGSRLSITSTEAAFQLSTPEYVSLLSTANSIAGANELALTLPLGYTRSRHPNGALFMFYNRDNSHVMEDIFVINNDVYGFIVISNSGEILTCSTSIANSLALEKGARENNSGLLLTERYRFNDPILFDFLQSDYDFFDEFVADFNEE